MTTEALVSRFEKIGATVALMERRTKGFWARQPSTPDIDVKTSNRVEQFIISNYDDPEYTFEVIDISPEKRHLLLMMKKDEVKTERHQKAEISKFLCGHDERHWFVAAIPEEAHVKNIEEAMDALKPRDVHSVSRNLRKKEKNKRHNKAWKRQGEWFFLPADNFSPDPLIVLKNEPILRTGSKPHMCEELVRMNGVVLWFHWGVAKEGVNDATKKILESKGNTSGWQSRMVDATVYVRGNITHPDHATIYLPNWCRVVMNEEAKAKARAKLRFLD
jgi:hypothetical protein